MGRSLTNCDDLIFFLRVVEMVFGVVAEVIEVGLNVFGDVWNFIVIDQSVGVCVAQLHLGDILSFDLTIPEVVH